jgi:putative flippase GtrA
MIAASFRRDASLQLPAFFRKRGTKQLLRYTVAGLGVTQFAAAIYSVLVLYFGVAALEANVASTACGLCAGYLVHSRWSFAGGAEGAEHAKIMRFLMTALAGFLVNSTWVWLLVTTAKLPPLAPLPLMMFATPWVSFLLNRHWVFKAA